MFYIKWMSCWDSQILFYLCVHPDINNSIICDILHRVYVTLLLAIESVKIDFDIIVKWPRPPFQTIKLSQATPLQWRHNGRDSVSNHQHHEFLLNRHSASLACMGNSPGTGEFPAQMASNTENVSIWWRHHDWDNHSMQHPPWMVNTVVSTWIPSVR